eukprot:SM000123S25849  [mRNA]  locus=s123:260211:262606:- [translate_table: standard]
MEVEGVAGAAQGSSRPRLSSIALTIQLGAVSSLILLSGKSKVPDDDEAEEDIVRELLHPPVNPSSSKESLATSGVVDDQARQTRDLGYIVESVEPRDYNPNSRFDFNTVCDIGTDVADLPRASTTTAKFYAHLALDPEREVIPVDSQHSRRHAFNREDHHQPRVKPRVTFPTLVASQASFNLRATDGVAAQGMLRDSLKNSTPASESREWDTIPVCNLYAGARVVPMNTSPFCQGSQFFAEARPDGPDGEHFRPRQLIKYTSGGGLQLGATSSSGDSVEGSRLAM